jgi:nicotinamidase-related amidase
MTSHTYDKATTALLVIDPYNDFLSEGGKVWPRVKEVAIEVGLLDNLRAISGAVRRAGIQTFIVPIVGGSRATMRLGAIPAQLSAPSCTGIVLHVANGAGIGIRILPRGTATSSSRSTGAQAGSRTPTSTCS